MFLSNDFFPLLDEFSSIKNRQNPSFDNLIEYIDISFGAAGLKNEIKVNVTNISSSLLYFPRSERGKRGPSYFSSIKAKVSGGNWQCSEHLVSIMPHNGYPLTRKIDVVFAA